MAIESEAMSKFSIGHMYATPAAFEAIGRAGLHPRTLLDRHQAGDWGDVDEEDKRANDTALKIKARLLSAYILAGGVKIWIITEADRSSTTILLPDEY